MNEPHSPEPITNSQATPGNPPKPDRRKLLMIVTAGVVAVAALGGGVWWTLHPNIVKPVATPTPATGVLRIGSIIDEDGLAANQQEFKPFINYMVNALHAEGI